MVVYSLFLVMFFSVPIWYMFFKLRSIIDDAIESKVKGRLLGIEIQLEALDCELVMLRKTLASLEATFCSRRVVRKPRRYRKKPVEGVCAND